MSYFAQDQAAVLNPGRTVYEEMSSTSPTTMVPMIRNILGGFLFSGDDVSKKCGVLSGGERNRLALAKMLLTPSNLLLLDEPTNHLDLDSKEVLLDALADYGGTLIFVSHDRYFVDRLANKVIEVGDGVAPLYPGGYEDFLHWKKLREAGQATALPTGAPPKKTSLQEPKAEAKPAASQTETHKPAPEARSPEAARPSGAKPGKSNGQHAAAKPTYDPLAPRLRPAGTPPDRAARDKELKKMKARLHELEKRIAEKEKAVKDIETQMASSGFYDDRPRAEEAASTHKALMWEVGDLMSQWESLQTEVEAG
jgi:ATP-binding cassette subfamily F protein 3